MLDWMTDLRRDGFVQLADRCDRRWVLAANRAIDESLRTRFDPTQKAIYDARSYCPELRETAPIRNLLDRSAVQTLLDTVLGGPWRFDRGQIAIRPAREADHPFVPPPHIDGVQTALNGLTTDRLSTYTVLVGVYLTQTPSKNAGNFTVWPGSHAQHAAWFRKQGPAGMRMGMPDIPHGEPRQLITCPGDVVICHYLTGHTAAANTSTVERRAVYFHVHLRTLRRDPFAHLVDPWRGWDLSG